MPFVLALDQGTTSSRAVVFDGGGAVRGMAQRELRQIYPEPGWVEHDPAEIWATQSGAMHEALAKAGITGRDVAAIGITNQRETTLLWERATGRPLANAIVWQDRRTAPTCDALRAAGHEATFTAKTGLVLDPYFSGTKLKWLLDHVPDARRRAARGELAFGTIDSWLVWQLTKGAVHVTDASNASRTLLYDIHTGTWDDDLLPTPRDPAGGPAARRAFVGRRRDDGSRRRIRADRGHRRRPAGGPVRAGLRPARPREEHVRHGLLSPPQHGAARRRLEEPAAHDRRLGPRGRPHVCPRGKRLHRRRRRAVAEGRSEAHPERRRRRGARRDRVRTTAASSSFRPSRGSARRTGTLTRGEPCSA